MNRTIFFAIDSGGVVAFHFDRGDLEGESNEAKFLSVVEFLSTIEEVLMGRFFYLMN